MSAWLEVARRAGVRPGRRMAGPRDPRCRPAALPTITSWQALGGTGSEHGLGRIAVQLTAGAPGSSAPQPLEAATLGDERLRAQGRRFPGRRLAHPAWIAPSGGPETGDDRGGDRLGRRHRPRARKDGLDRRVVAETDLTPLVDVVAVDESEARRCEHVVEAVRCLAAGSRVNDPRGVLPVVSVGGAECVDQIPFRKPDQQGPLRRVPALHVLRMVGSKGLHLTVLALPPRGVQIAAEDPVAIADPGEALEQRFAGLHLDQAVGGSRRDVGVVDSTARTRIRRLPRGRARAAVLRSPGARQVPPTCGQVEQAAGAAKVEESTAWTSPRPASASHHRSTVLSANLLKGNEIRLPPRNRSDLIGEQRRSPGKVPAQQLQGIRKGRCSNGNTAILRASAIWNRRRRPRSRGRRRRRDR